MQKIESIYDAFKIMNQIDDGDLPYPSADTKGDGMALEVRYAHATHLKICKLIIW